MRKRSLILPLVLGLLAVAALPWLLGSGEDAVSAAFPPPPTPTPLPVPRHVAVTGADGGNDCTAPGAPCRTLQHAVDAAQPREVIKVAQGTYDDVHMRAGASQLVYLDKNLTLRGGYTTTNDFAGPPRPDVRPTILDAQGQGRVVVIDGAGATIDGFTITGGAGYYSGGGIYADGGTGVIVQGSRIVGNEVNGDGGALFINGGSAQILDNVIADNTGTWGAGLRIINDADVAVVHNEIRSNVAQIAAGGVDVDCCGGTRPLIAQNLIVANDGAGGGGGIAVRFTNARLVNNVIALNGADRGAGILLEASASFPLSVTLAHNTLVGGGDGDEGLRAGPYAAATLVNNVVASYTVGITNTGPASATVIADRTLFQDNATDHGPGVSSTNAIAGSPAFVDPAAGDYHITGASAAEGAGVDAGVRVDIDNDLRLGVPDVGADEYWAPGALKRAYLPLISVSPYPDQPPQVEPQPGRHFPCPEGCETGCTGDASNWVLVERDFAYQVVGEDPWCAPWCDLEPGDVVIEVSGRIRNDADVAYWTWVTGAAYDAEGDFLSDAIRTNSWFFPNYQCISAHGTGEFAVYLKSHRDITRIQIRAGCASSMPLP